MVNSLRVGVFALLVAFTTSIPIARAQQLPDPQELINQPSLLHPDQAATALVAQILGGEQLPGGLALQLFQFLRDNGGGSDLLNQFSPDFAKTLIGNLTS